MDLLFIKLPISFSAVPIPLSQHPLMKGTFRLVNWTTSTTTASTTTTEVYNSWEPHFVGRQHNLTVVEGRDAHFVCQVRNLENYSVSILPQFSFQSAHQVTVLIYADFIETSNYGLTGLQVVL